MRISSILMLLALPSVHTLPSISAEVLNLYSLTKTTEKLRTYKKTTLKLEVHSQRIRLSLKSCVIFRKNGQIIEAALYFKISLK
jgi:hypothetical protein